MLSIRLVLAAGLAVGLAFSPALGQEKPHDPSPARVEPGQGKKVVKTQDDLPRHTYTIEGKASEFVLTDAPFKAFVAQVKADTEGDLAEYDIQDPTTRQGYYGVLQQIAVFEGRYADAAALVEKVRALEAKESKRLMAGQMLLSMIEAEKAAPGATPDDAEYAGAFKAELDKRVRALPWSKVKEEVNQAKGRAEIISRDLALGSIQGALDPVVEAAHGKVSGDMVKNLVGVRVMIDKLLPLQPAVAAVYGGIAADNEKLKVAAKDIWSPSQVTLTEADHGTPVVIGIWDSGVDTTLFKGRLWTNAAEVAGNGKDDDGNGFVDDEHGIGFDLNSERVTGLLADLSELTHDRALMQRYTKGFSDLTSNIDSAEATAVKKYISTLKQAEVTPFTEDLGAFGAFCHGTHVAGIASAGNPYARVLAARISFDHKAIPRITPNMEDSLRNARAITDTVAYFRKAGVRVVNMSWGGDREGIEKGLEMKGWGKSQDERASLSRELFKVERDALDKAMRSAPEILFVAAAGNSDNDNDFAELLPSGLRLPNMVTIGAIDASGKPTGFTTFGKNVTLYANGFEVESWVPGGEKMKFNGTSMAAPNAANLAAKLVALDPKLTTEQVIDLMARGADPMEGQQGRLIIDAKRSIEMLKSKKG